MYSATFTFENNFFAFTHHLFSGMNDLLARRTALNLQSIITHFSSLWHISSFIYQPTTHKSLIIQKCRKFIECYLHHVYWTSQRAKTYFISRWALWKTLTFADDKSRRCRMNTYRGKINLLKTQESVIHYIIQIANSPLGIYYPTI